MITKPELWVKFTGLFKDKQATLNQYVTKNVYTVHLREM